MAKDLPYFKFFCSEWSDGDITLEDFETQGLFINICAYYWSNECVVEYSKLVKKFRGYDLLITNLINSNIIKVKDIFITISFLDKQLEDREKLSKQNSKNIKDYWDKKRGLNESNTTVSNSLNENNTIKIREDKIREENININIYKELLISESWIEINAKNNRTTPDKVKLYLKKFNNNLIAQGEKKNNKREYQSHFARWLPIELAKEVKDKPKFTPLI